MQDIRKIESVTGHLLAAVGRAFLKIVTFFLSFAAIGVAGVEGVSYASGLHAPTVLTHIAAGVFGAVLGYAAGLTTAVTEAIKGLIEAGKDAAKEVQNVEKTALGDLAKVQGAVGTVAKAVGNEAQNLEHRK